MSASTMRLGRLPHHPEAVARAPKLSARMPAPSPPARLDRSHIDYRPGLLGNDAWPDCTAVSIANAAIGFTAANDGALAVSQADVGRFYAATAGIPVEDIAASDGALLIDAMHHQCVAGLPDASGQVLVTGPFGTIYPADRALIATACALIGPVVLGVNLTMADQHPGVWDIGRPGADKPWGGHAVTMWDYTGLGDADTVRIATWGALQAVTWRWLYAQCQEAYVAAWRDLMPADGRSWGGLDYDGLAADVATWCGT